MKKLFLFVMAAMLTSTSCSHATNPVKGVPVPENLTNGAEFNLYDGVAPGSENPKFQEAAFGEGDQSWIINVSDPTLTVYLPEKPNGTSMIVCPGGGFLGLCIESEGRKPAIELNQYGITVFVLKYRPSTCEKEDGQAPGNVIEMAVTMMKRLQDASNKFSAEHDGAHPNVTQICSQLPNWDFAFADADRAITIVRQNAEKWGLNPDKIGIMGFSAGGITSVHQAMTHTADSKPNFAAAIYGGWTNDVKAPEDACPLWMCSPVNDAFDPAESYDVYRAWRDAKVPTELHTFWDAVHGYGISRQGKGVDAWDKMLIQFMRDVNFLETK